jgi:putative acetyltransferase
MSTPSIVIRPERPDHPQVRALLRQLDAYLASLYEPEDNHILDEPTLMAPDVTFLVASDDQHILGCGAVRRMPAEVHTQQRPYGEVKRMMVDPRARGHRIGARLLQALEALLRADRIELALLETGAQQVEALRLYERNGYRRRASFGGYPDNGLSVFYEKALSQ